MPSISHPNESRTPYPPSPPWHPDLGVPSRCSCGWTFALRLPEHGETFVCPACHQVKWGQP